MDIIFIFIGYISAFILGTLCRHPLKGQRNKVHFYVARDIDGGLWLYLRKPERRRYSFISSYGICGTLMVNKYHFKDVGLNPDDFKDLKWEDEPVEVFVNMED